MNTSTRPQFALLDFLKMFFAALGCGVAFSVVVVGITLAIAGVAEAQMPAMVKPLAAEAKLPTNPGALVIGEGCENEALVAVARDWRVRITDNVAEITVTQDFAIPEEGAATAGFDFSLPQGGVLKALVIQTAKRKLTGHLVATSKLTGMSREELQKLDRKNKLTVWTGSETMHTDQILDLTAGEMIQIEYRYQIAIVAGAGHRSLALSLQPAALGEAHAPKYFSNARPTPTSGTVAVEWNGSQPIHLIHAPRDASFARNEKGVTGLSWTNLDLEAGAALNLAWAHQG